MTMAARQMTLKAAETISHIQQSNESRRVRTGTLVSCWGGSSGSEASGRTWRYVGVAIEARARSATYSEITKSSNHIHNAVKYGKGSCRRLSSNEGVEGQGLQQFVNLR